MARRGSRLAARLKAGIDHQLAEERRQEEEQRRKIAAAQKLRDELLADLREFGEAVGHFAVAPASPEGGVRLTFGDRELVFEPSGELSDVSVSGTGVGDAATISMQPELQKWVLRWSRRGSRESVLLFDQGLEVLLRAAFDIVPAEAAPAPSPSEAAPSDRRGAKTL